MDIDRIGIEVAQLKKDFARLKASPLGRIIDEHPAPAAAPQNVDNSAATRLDEMKDHAQEVNKRLDSLDQSVGQGAASKIMDAVQLVERFAGRLDAIESRIEDIADHPALSIPPVSADGAPRQTQAQAAKVQGDPRGQAGGTAASGNAPRPTQQQQGGGGAGKPLKR